MTDSEVSVEHPDREEFEAARRLAAALDDPSAPADPEALAVVRLFQAIAEEPRVEDIRVHWLHKDLVARATRRRFVRPAFAAAVALVVVGAVAWASIEWSRTANRSRSLAEREQAAQMAVGALGCGNFPEGQIAYAYDVKWKDRLDAALESNRYSRLEAARSSTSSSPSGRAASRSGGAS